jgi:hypothetical protein
MRSTGWESKNPTLFWVSIFLLMCLTCSMSFNFFQYFYLKTHCGGFNKMRPGNIEHVREMERQELERLRSFKESISRGDTGQGSSKDVKEGKQQGSGKSQDEDANGDGPQKGAQSRSDSGNSGESAPSKQGKIANAVVKSTTAKSIASRQASNEKPGQWINSTEPNQKILLDVGANCGEWIQQYRPGMVLVFCACLTEHFQFLVSCAFNEDISKHSLKKTVEICLVTRNLIHGTKCQKRFAECMHVSTCDKLCAAKKKA